MLTKEHLAGEWALTEFIIEDTQHNKRNWQHNCRGLLIYTLSGYMSVSINSDIEDDLTSPTNIFNSILFYAGLYKVHHDRKIVHDVLHASDPNRIGKKIIREAVLEGDLLTLQGKVILEQRRLLGNELLRFNEIII